MSLITLEEIEAKIVAEHYWQVPGDAVVVCALTFENDYTVIGHAAVLLPENFDLEIGKQVARNDAIHQVIPLLAYEKATELRGL